MRGATVEEQRDIWIIEVESAKAREKPAKSMETILEELKGQKLLSKEEVEEIKANANNEITIGSKRISFKIEDYEAPEPPIEPEKPIIGDGSWTGSVNSPKLANGMTPIVYDATVTTINGNIPAYWREAKNEAEWYSYKNTATEGANSSKWANAVTEDGSMWVWIPRYEYKIVSGEGTSTAGEIDVKFIPTTTNSKNGGITSGYRIHPAFENGSSTGKNNNYMNGEWDTELDGIWVAKFEASRSNSTGSNIGTSTKIKIGADVKSWINITIGECYTNSLNMFPKYNSHLMKNSEWGACAYLTHSKYGRNRTEVTINANSGIVTGGGNYRTNTNQSSTGNQYGIYDLSGGAMEYTAGYITNGTANLASYGSSMVGVNTTADLNGYKTKSSKTVTVYPYNSSNSYTIYKALKTSIYGYGDGILETSTTGTGSTSWNGDYSYFPHPNLSFFKRGGNYNYASDSGVFAFYYYERRCSSA